MGREPLERKTLLRFIGPPLTESYSAYCSMSPDESMQAVSYYRQRYEKKGIFECEVYPGVLEMLKKLSEAGLILAVATSKPERMAVRISANFGFDKYLKLVVGSDITETQTKTDVINAAFSRLEIDKSELKNVIMIGDRSFDVYGAHNCGIKCMGVGYGYGSFDELSGAGCDFFAKTPEQAAEITLKKASE